jgi:hypothetical protein
MAANFTPLQPNLAIVQGDLRLVCGCSAMETHFMKLPTNSYCAGVASRGSLELTDLKGCPYTVPFGHVML